MDILWTGEQIQRHKRHWAEESADMILGWTVVHGTTRPRSKVSHDGIAVPLPCRFLVGKCYIITARKRSLGQGNMFTGVCLSTGGVHDQVHSPDQVHPPEQTPPQSRHPLEPGAPHRADTPQDQVHPPRPGTPPPPGADTPRDQVHPPPGADTPQTRYAPLGPGTPPREQPPGPGTPPQCRACWEIRSTCGRYASYWNAILFSKSAFKWTVDDWNRFKLIVNRLNGFHDETVIVTSPQWKLWHGVYEYIFFWVWINLKQKPVTFTAALGTIHMSPLMCSLELGTIVAIAPYKHY